MRIIARLDIKGPNVVKGIHMEGLRVVGKPEDLSLKYGRYGPDEGGACELLYVDTVSSLYGLNRLPGLLDRTVSDIYIPITAGGGIRSLEDVQRLLNSGADMVMVNTYALERPQFINEVAYRYGSQALCVCIEAKRGKSGWEAYTHGGREKTGRDAIQWAREAVDRGAGQILLASVDMDGTRKGFDLDLISSLVVEVPVVACGGCGSVKDIIMAKQAGADAVAIASVLHYNILTLKEIRDGLAQSELQAQDGSYSRGSTDRCDEGLREESFREHRGEHGVR